MRRRQKKAPTLPASRMPAAVSSATRYGAANQARVMSHPLPNPADPRSSGSPQHDAAQNPAAAPPPASSSGTLKMPRYGTADGFGFVISSPLGLATGPAWKRTERQ